MEKKNWNWQGPCKFGQIWKQTSTGNPILATSQRMLTHTAFALTTTLLLSQPMYFLTCTFPILSPSHWAGVSEQLGGVKQVPQLTSHRHSYFCNLTSCPSWKMTLKYSTETVEVKTSYTWLHKVKTSLKLGRVLSCLINLPLNFLGGLLRSPASGCTTHRSSTRLQRN